MGELGSKLTGRVIALPETRELDLFAQMLEKRGAITRRCPLVGIHDTPDAAPIEAWLRQCIDGDFDDLILITGEGLRRLRGFAARADLHDDFVASLHRLRRITRGPKPARELRKLGLAVDIPATQPTTDGVIDALRKEKLDGRHVAVQLYGDNPNRPLVEFLESAGATVTTVAPYIYADAAEGTAVIALIESMSAGEIDAIGFTSSPQVARLSSVARKENLEDTLARGMAQTTVAAVGPLVADALREAGFEVDLMPADSFFLKPMVNELATRLGPKT